MVGWQIIETNFSTTLVHKEKRENQINNKANQVRIRATYEISTNRWRYKAKTHGDVPQKTIGAEENIIK